MLIPNRAGPRGFVPPPANTADPAARGSRRQNITPTSRPRSSKPGTGAGPGAEPARPAGLHLRLLPRRGNSPPAPVVPSLRSPRRARPRSDRSQPP